jgi:energy-coupling factor transporter ATP-binding protein EcfA2
MDEIARNADRAAVFDNGQIVMDAPPAQVFSRGGELSAMGLGVPAAAAVASRLRARGLPIGADVITAEGLRAAVRELRGGRG